MTRSCVWVAPRRRSITMAPCGSPRSIKFSDQSREAHAQTYCREQGDTGGTVGGGTWVFEGKKIGTHLTKLNNSHEKVLDAINPCARCGRMISEHKSEVNDARNTNGGTVLEFVLYDLRHSFATRMVEAGCSLPALAAILGHSGLRMVMRYVHPQQEHKDAAMVRYEQYMAGRSLVAVPEGRVQLTDFKALLGHLRSRIAVKFWDRA